MGVYCISFSSLLETGVRCHEFTKVKVLIERRKPNLGTTQHFRKPSEQVRTNNCSYANTPKIATATKRIGQNVDHIRLSPKAGVVLSVEPYNSKEQHLLSLILKFVLGDVKMPEPPMPHKSDPPEKPHGSFSWKPWPECLLNWSIINL